jgi:2-oxoglutarate ferredoxin oxidoreductase subunit alpha
MNDWLCAPLAWDDKRTYDRGKVMTPRIWTASRTFGRYLDVDGDGIPYRTYPGTHPTKGAYFTRGTSRDEYAIYSEEGAAYVRNMERLLKEVRDREAVRARQPKMQAGLAQADALRRDLFRLDHARPMDEALEMLEAEGIAIDALRVRAFPFSRRVEDFIMSTRRSSWSSRTATRRCAPADQRDAICSTRASWCRCCTTTARRSRRASSRPSSAPRSAGATT